MKLLQHQRLLLKLKFKYFQKSISFQFQYFLLKHYEIAFLFYLLYELAYLTIRKYFRSTYGTMNCRKDFYHFTYIDFIMSQQTY